MIVFNAFTDEARTAIARDWVPADARFVRSSTMTLIGELSNSIAFVEFDLAVVSWDEPLTRIVVRLEFSVIGKEQGWTLMSVEGGKGG